MFAALGIHSFPIANGEQLCHARNLSRVLCPQSKPPAEEERFDAEDCQSSSPMGKDPTIRIRKKIVQISVKRDSDGSLGFTLCGGIIEDNPSLSRPLVVSHVRRGGPVEREGSIRAGDRLLAVDGHSVEHASLSEAQALLQHRRYCENWKEDDLDSSQGKFVDSCTGECFTLLVVEYDVVDREDLAKSPGPFLVELQLDYPDEELGLSLAMLPEEWPLSQKQRPAALVEAVRAASIAERCGALHSGDIILSIEKVPLGEAGSKCDDESLIDAAQSFSWLIRIEVLPLSQIDRATSSRSTECEKSERSKRAVSQPPPHDGCSSSSAESLIWNSHRSQRWPLPSPPPPPCRRTPTHIMGCTNSEVAKVPCEEITNLEEFLQMTYIRDSNDSEEMISWQRNGSMSLGGTTAAADCSLRSDIKVESQDQMNFARVKPLSWFDANEDNNIIEEEERCSSSQNGGLESGDDRGDLNDSSSNCFQFIPFEDEGEAVIYVVKVYRSGGPLGITLSGTEDPSENIIISALVDGGPAKSTAALCVGDRLLAVGRETLAGKPLSEAVALLRAASDPVTLRIARSLELCPISENPLVGNGMNPVRNMSRPCEIEDSYLSRVSNSISEVINKDGDDATNGHSVRLPCSCPSANCRHHPHLTSSNNNNSSCAVLRGSLPYELDPCSSSLNHSSPSSVGSGRGPLPLPSETLGITLFKDGIYEDFGFSVSDGLYERGVYVNRIRKGGPADVGSLKPYDRIIQVNDTITYAFDCCLTVPLIASAGDKIQLTVMRYPHFVTTTKGLSY